MSLDQKVRESVSVTVEGYTRPSQFHSWSYYNLQGPINRESVTGTYHGKLNGRWSGGGPVFISRETDSHVVGQKFNTTHQGAFYIYTSTTGVSEDPRYSIPSDDQLIVDGTHAIAMTVPTSPILDLSVSLAELKREGLPSPAGLQLWREKTRVAKGAGSEYLNTQFGWMPLVRDVNAFAYIVSEGDKILERYQREANKPIKRTFKFPELSETTYKPSSFVCLPGTGGFASGGGLLTTRFQRKWFEAEYMYYLPTGGNITDKSRRYGSYARKLLGTPLTPEVLWNLAPWSWAADWFGNTGEILHNLSAFRTDGLVMRYGYIMCHTSRSTHKFGFQGGQYLSNTMLRETKQRLPATPYGFGVAFNGLTLRQAAVVAALGLSRW